VKIVGSDYIPLPRDKATIIKVGGESRLSKLLGGGKSILRRLGPIFDIGGKIALPIALTYEAVDTYLKQRDQDQALDVIIKSFKAIQDQQDLISKRIDEGNLTKEDVQTLQVELANMEVLMLAMREKLLGMNAAAPSNAIMVKGTFNRGGLIFLRIPRLKKRLEGVKCVDEK
jgi:hypothetical protein